MIPYNAIKHRTWTEEKHVEYHAELRLCSMTPIETRHLNATAAAEAKQNSRRIIVGRLYGEIRDNAQRAKIELLRMTRDPLEAQRIRELLEPFLNAGEHLLQEPQPSPEATFESDARKAG